MKEQILKLLVKYVELDSENDRTILSDEHFEKVADEIIKLKNFNGSIPDEQSNPNTRLISAAPDLYDIVKELLGDYSGLCGINIDFKERVKKALNKVSG